MQLVFGQGCENSWLPSVVGIVPGAAGVTVQGGTADQLLSAARCGILAMTRQSRAGVPIGAANSPMGA